MIGRINGKIINGVSLHDVIAIYRYEGKKALNIMRKVFGDSSIEGIVDRGRLFRPVKSDPTISGFANKTRHIA